MFERTLKSWKQRDPCGVGLAADPRPMPKFPFDSDNRRALPEGYAAVPRRAGRVYQSPRHEFRPDSAGHIPHGFAGKRAGPQCRTTTMRRCIQVTLTRPFYLCKHETTVGQFRRFVEATKYITDIEKTGGGNAHDDKSRLEPSARNTMAQAGFRRSLRAEGRASGRSCQPDR